MSESSPPRPRGRPKGSLDTYPRERRYKKQPPVSVVQVILPAMQELVDTAIELGYNKAFGVAPKQNQEAVDKAVAKLLAKIKEVLDAQ